MCRIWLYLLCFRERERESGGSGRERASERGREGVWGERERRGVEGREGKRRGK